MSKVIYVGPETDNPDKTLMPQVSVFTPALGASWQLPWFGQGKTTIRGGFQRTYGRAGALITGGLLSGPGGGSSSGADITALNPSSQHARRISRICLWQYLRLRLFQTTGVDLQGWHAQWRVVRLCPLRS